MSLTEALRAELGPTVPHLSFHTVCPFIVDTKISTSQRNRPASLDKEGDRSAHMLPGVEQGVDVWSDGSGMPPSKVADHLFDAAIESGDFCEGAVTPSRVCARVCSLADAQMFQMSMLIMSRTLIFVFARRSSVCRGCWRRRHQKG